VTLEEPVPAWCGALRSGSLGTFRRDISITSTTVGSCSSSAMGISHSRLAMSHISSATISAIGTVPRGAFFGFGSPSFKWHHRGLPFDKPRPDVSEHLKGFGHDPARPEMGRDRGADGDAPSQAILEQLEAQGFREVPKLFREWSHRPHTGMIQLR
jgi:hypothetical protein